jgi:hypothetical protein
MAPSQSKHQKIMQAAEPTRDGIVLERHNEGKQQGEREAKESRELDARAKEWTPQSKGRRKAVKVVAATQNVRGLTTEYDREEIKLQMGRQGIHVVCGQETWMQDDKAMERWDSGELFINCGGQKKGKHEGVCFFLSKAAATMFEQGGRRLKKCCSRLATMRLQIHEGRDLYFVNAHAPDSGQSTAKKETFQRRLEAALDTEKHSDVLALTGDFNASTGIAEDANDEECGEFGIPHVNDAGRSLKMAAAMYQLRDLLTFEEQKFYGTWGPRPVEKLASIG